LLFVVVAGGLAFLQLAYHVNYLIERYALEYSIRTSTTTTTTTTTLTTSRVATPPSSSLLSREHPDEVVKSPAVIRKRTSNGVRSTIADGTSEEQMLEIKITTTTTTTRTDSGKQSRPDLVGDAPAHDPLKYPATIDAPVKESLGSSPTLTAATVKTQELNVGAETAASSSSVRPDWDRHKPSNDDRIPSRIDKGSPENDAATLRRSVNAVVIGAPLSLSLLHQPHRRCEVLIVVPGLGDAQRIPNVERSLQKLHASTQKGGHGFGCRVFVWNADILAETRDRLALTGCDVQLSVGMWTHHMSRVPSLADTNYTHVAVLMDDVDVTGVELGDFLALMDWSGFGVASPAFDDPIYPSMRARYNCFFHRTDFINIFFAVFTRDAWVCWQDSLIDTDRNPLGWGMDATLHRVCNVSLGVLDAHLGVHKEKRTSYSQAEARRQMYEFIAGRVGAADPKKYLECAGQTRPAAFEECQLYWDGTEAKAVVVDWEC
jgi:hypothetical protein